MDLAGVTALNEPSTDQEQCTKASAMIMGSTKCLAINRNFLSRSKFTRILSRDCCDPRLKALLEY
jgi:hypothetical protein